ncbi:hypothetical protein QIW57_07020 [Francisellaceae bacterium CB52]
MKLKKIVLVTSVVLGTVTASFAVDNDIDTSVDMNSVNTIVVWFFRTGS